MAAASFIFSERHHKMMRAFFLPKKYLLILQWRVYCAAVHHQGILFRDTSKVFWANSREGFTVPARLSVLMINLRHCALLAVLSCFTNPKNLICMRSCCSRREQRHERIPVQLVRGVCVLLHKHLWHRTAAGFSVAALKLPCRETARNERGEGGKT